MTEIAGSVTTDGAVDRFPSPASLRATHSELLIRRRLEGDKPELLDEVEALLHRGKATGALLDTDEDRWACQSLLDYWSNILYRAGRTPPDGTLDEFDPMLAPELPDELCPYLGLAAFREADHSRFFGRQRLIQDWAGRLLENRLLTVVGASGSGKSSLVLGGLVPALKAGALPGSDAWRYYPPMAPGSDPLTELARVTRPSAVSAAEWIERQVESFQQDPDRLARLIGENVDVPAVLVVDQFEEVFTLSENEASRDAFIRNLLGLIHTSDARHIVILTMRSDFEPYLARLPELHELFAETQVRVTALNAGELRDVIEKPAELVGLKFEQGIIEQLIREILGEPAALPLLQFALRKLWDARERNRVTWEGYRRLGGARRALAGTADAFYRALIPEEQSAARRILLRLVRPGEGVEVTSNRLQREDLYRSGEASDRVNRVIDKLAAAGLVRLTDGEKRADDRVEVAHEAIVRNWPTFVAWLDNERVNMRQRLRLTATAQQWRVQSRDTALLLRGGQLQLALSYRDLNEIETEFVQASQGAVQQAEREKEEARRRELEQAQALAAEQQMRADAERQRAEVEGQAARRLRRFSIALAVALMFAIITTMFAMDQWRQAQENERDADAKTEQAMAAQESSVAASATASALKVAAEADRDAARRQRQLASSRRLAVEGVSLLRDQLDLAVLVGLEAFSVADTFEARSSLVLEQEYSRDLSAFLRGHTDPVSSVAFSPNGRLLASGSCGQQDEDTGLCQQGEIRLWDLASGEQIGTRLTNHAAGVSSVVFSPDGRWLASGHDDGTLNVWDLITGRPRQPALLGHSAPVVSVVFSTDGETLTSVSEEGMLLRWDVASGQRSGLNPMDHAIPGAVLVLSPDARMLASGDTDGILVVWDVATGQQLGPPLTGHTMGVASVAFSPDGKSLASVSRDKTVILWDVASGQNRVAPLTGHASAVTRVAFSPDGTTLVSASNDGVLLMWEVATGRLLGRPLKGRSAELASVMFSPDARTLAAGSVDGTLILWDVTARQPFDPTLAARASAVAFSADATKAASGDRNGTLTLRDVTTGQQIGPLPNGHTAAVSSVAFSPDGTLAVSGGQDKAVVLWDVATGQQLGSPLTGHTMGVASVAFSPDGKLVASGSRDMTVMLWDTSMGRPSSPPLTGHSAGVLSVAFSPDGQMLASGGQDRAVILWDLAARGPIGAPLMGHSGDVVSVAFSRDGKMLASGGRDNAVMLWDAATGQQYGPPLRGHATTVVSLAFSQDGRTLVSGSGDNALILWDVLESRRLELIPASSVYVLVSVAFSADGKTLLAGSRDSTLLRWDYDVEAWRNRACQRVRRSLTLDEQRQYLDGESERPTCPSFPPG